MTWCRAQQEGVDWLAFLRQYGLHGVLSRATRARATPHRPLDCAVSCQVSSRDHSRSHEITRDHSRSLEITASVTAGVLSDEMGLGKTLQTLCILAASRHDELQRPQPRPSLVVCPATLVSHWRGEAARRARRGLGRV